MSFNYASAHARVFDNVRTARYRALADARSEAPDQSCVYDTNPAAGLWVNAESGAISPLCRAHLNSSLDTVYQVDDEDPPVIVPLKKRRRDA